MKQKFISEKSTYDGSQLRSLYAYLEHGVLGNSVISWVGKCAIPFSHMVDGEDLLAEASIQGEEMLHFIVEIFDRDLFSAVALQRMFAAITKDYLQSQVKIKPAGSSLRRSGDDIYLEDAKLSISIASKSPVSVMVHFAMNITNEGTPVKTLCLNDLGLDAKVVATDLMNLFTEEFSDMLIATQKVRPLN